MVQIAVDEGGPSEGSFYQVFPNLIYFPDKKIMLLGRPCHPYLVDTYTDYLSFKYSISIYEIKMVVKEDIPLHAKNS